MEKQGYLTVINGKPQVVTPHTKPVKKAGKTQFWFYDNGKPKLAIRGEKDFQFRVS